MSIFVLHRSQAIVDPQGQAITCLSASFSTALTRLNEIYLSPDLSVSLTKENYICSQNRMSIFIQGLGDKF